MYPMSRFKDSHKGGGFRINMTVLHSSPLLAVSQPRTPLSEPILAISIPREKKRLETSSRRNNDVRVILSGALPIREVLDDGRPGTEESRRDRDRGAFPALGDGEAFFAEENVDVSM